MPGLINFAPSSAELLEIEPEELGLILIGLAHEIPAPGRNFTVAQFEMPLWNANAAGYPHHARQSVVRAIAEAWQWLISEGLIIPDPDQPSGYFRLTRKAERLKNRADLEAYKKRGLLARSNLHPSLLEKVYPMFVRGDYELATIEAFKQVEIRVRASAALSADLVGVDLMRAAFNPKNGALTDRTAVKSEQEALAHLFAGAFGHGRNPVSHRAVNLNSSEAAGLIGLANYLLSIVETRAAKITRHSP